MTFLTAWQEQQAMKAEQDAMAAKDGTRVLDTEPRETFEEAEYRRELQQSMDEAAAMAVCYLQHNPL